jgi:lysophospholipase L1-like esterase
MVAMLRRAPITALVALAVAAGACGSAADESVDVTAAPVQTVAGVGVLPDTVPSGRQQRVFVPAPVNADGTPADLIGEVAPGNRVLIIGDSIIASTSSRYGRQMCDELVPLGWQVAVEAEPSRFVDFGNRVLDRMLDDDPTPETDWHAAVVFLGSNYRGDPFAYAVELEEILDRLAPRPTVLFTVTEYRSNYAAVNDVIRGFAEDYDNVTLLDWQQIAEEPGVLSGDRLHPTDLGREVLAQAVAGALGPVSIGDGECLRSEFSDDSGIGRGGGGSSVGSSSRSSSSGGSQTITTTTRPATTTTVVDSGDGSVTTTTTGGDGGGDGGDGGVTTTAATTVPVTTAPPPVTTSPPAVTTTAPVAPAAPAPPADG